MTTELMTTAAVVARPTPSAPPVVKNPLVQPVTERMRPNTAGLDQSREDVVEVQELERLLPVDDGVGAQQADRHHVAAEDAEAVGERRPGAGASAPWPRPAARSGSGSARWPWRRGRRSARSPAWCPSSAASDGADAPGDHQRGQHRRQLAGQRERHHRRDEALGVEALEAPVGLERHDHAGEHRGQADDGDASRRRPGPSGAPTARRSKGRAEGPVERRVEDVEELADLLEDGQGATRRPTRAAGWSTRQG